MTLVRGKRHHSEKLPSLKRFRESKLTRAVLRAAKHLGLTQAELGRILGKHVSTVSRMAKGSCFLREGRTESERVIVLIRLYGCLSIVLADDRNVMSAWMRNVNTRLDAIPAKEIKRTNGLVGVLEYLYASMHGMR